MQRVRVWFSSIFEDTGRSVCAGDRKPAEPGRH